MSFPVAIELTRPTLPIQFQEVRKGGETQRFQQESFVITQTELPQSSSSLFRTTSNGTMTGKEVRQSVERPPAEDVRTLSDVIADTTVRDRTRLLIQKFAGTESRESNARLDILTERLRRLNPRVTDKDFDHLSALVDKLEATSDSLAKLKQKYRV